MTSRFRCPESALAWAILRRAWADSEYLCRGHIPDYLLVLEDQRRLQATPEGRKQLFQVFHACRKDLEDFLAGTLFRDLVDIIGGEPDLVREQFRIKLSHAKDIRKVRVLKQGEERTWAVALERMEEG